MTYQYVRGSNKSSQKDTDNWILQRTAVRSLPAKTLTPQTESPVSDRSGIKPDVMPIPVSSFFAMPVQQQVDNPGKGITAVSNSQTLQRTGPEKRKTTSSEEGEGSSSSKSARRDEGAQQSGSGTDLEDFLKGVWGLKGTNGLLNPEGPTKAALDDIYKKVYSREVKKTLPEKQTPLLIKICDWVISKKGYPQEQGQINNKKTAKMQEPLNVLNKPKENPKDFPAAYNMVTKNYFFIPINKEVEMNHRISINAKPASVLDVAKTVYDIVYQERYAKTVNRFKFAGPRSASEKLDALIVYCDRNDAQYQAMLTAITNAGLDLHIASGEPVLMGKAGNGIGVGDQPSGETRKLSFGQKRVSLAVMALRHSSDSWERFLQTAMVFFRSGGLDPSNPQTEHGGLTDPRIIKELVRHESIWNSKTEKDKR